MSQVKAVGVSFLDGMVFGSYTVGPVIGIFWAIGFIRLTYKERLYAKERKDWTMGTRVRQDLGFGTPGSKVARNL